MTPEERERRKHERSAARKNAKILADVPLYADQLPAHDAAGEYWRWRFNKAGAAENCSMIEGNRLLGGLHVNRLRRFALATIGPEAFGALDAYCRRTYPHGPTYWYGFWKGVLTGERIESGWRRVENRQPGQPACVPLFVYEQQHMTAADFYAEFPYTTSPPAADFAGAVDPRLDSVPRDG